MNQWKCSIAGIILVMLLGGCAHPPSRPWERPPSHEHVGNDSSICTDGPKSRSGNPKKYVVFGRRYRVMDTACGFSQTGLASWYGSKFHGKKTSSGEIYNMNAISAAHKTLPIPVYVKVTNLDNQRTLVVRVNDRGPFHKGRIIDLSKAAADKLGVLKKGTARVRIDVMGKPLSQVKAFQQRQAAVNDQVGSGNWPPAQGGLGLHEPSVPEGVMDQATCVSCGQSTSSDEINPQTVETFALDGVSDDSVVVKHELKNKPMSDRPGFIQVGSFYKITNAESLKTTLIQKGHNNVKVYLFNTPSGVALYRVRLGLYQSEMSAQTTLQILLSQGYAQAKWLSDK